MLIAAPLSASRAEAPADLDFTALSLEELMDVEVTSVSKRRQRLADAAAAVFVISEDDIRRSGATSVPELLRMAPGVEVAQIDANKWAVTIRGFNGRFASKLLVMIDGRSVYNPLFSGVFWDVQDIMLEDIDRIEVIRGPGATLWGANAVNGVINIITKTAKESQGVLVSGGGGTEQRAFAAARYGGQIGADAFYRAYVKGAKIDDGALSSGDSGADETTQGRTGFRVDWDPTDKDAITFSGDLFKQDYGSTAVTQPILVPPYSVTFDDRGKAHGGNVLARWGRELSETSAVALQGYYERLDKEEQGIGVTTDIADVDFQHEFALFDWNHFVWGVGYRYTHTEFDGDGFVILDPDRRSESLFSAFVQDEISLIRDELRFTVGTKFEHNDSTGYEIQPSARLLWTPTSEHSLWSSVSRAVRTPSIGEEDGDLRQAVLPPAPPFVPFPTEIRIFGNPDLGSEELLAFELGYRTSMIPDVSIDIAAFYNMYDGLRGGGGGAPFFDPGPPPRIVVPFTPNENNSGHTYGVEVAADWEVLPWWRLKAAYSFLATSIDAGTSERGTSPSHQASLRSMMDLGGGWHFDLWPRYVDNLPALGIESYFDLDARLAWRPNETVEFAIVGQNLIDSRRKEFVPEFLPMTATQVERGVYGKITVNF